MARMKKHMSHGSPRSIAASTGPGPRPGAGELHSPGSMPGQAAMRTRSYTQENPVAPAASSAAPKGMKTYNQE